MSQSSSPDVIEAAVERIEPLLRRSESDKRPVALMVCGCSGKFRAVTECALPIRTCIDLMKMPVGSGKSSLSKAVVKALPHFERISFDGITAARHGLYNIDYPASEHERISDETDEVFFKTATQFLTDGRDVVLDRAFYAKEDREAYKNLVDGKGGRCVLVYLKAPKEVLWQRIGSRREAGVTADCALEISKELLDMFYDNFDVPRGEGEIVVDTDA